MAIEQFWGKSISAGEYPHLDLELLDQGKQSKLAHVQERFGPQKFIFSGPAISWSDKGAMEMGNGSKVQGVTGQGACKKTVYVVGKMRDDHLDDILGKPGGRGQACRGSIRGTTSRMRSLDYCQASIPNSITVVIV